MVNLVWKRKKYPGTSGSQDFPGFSILRYVCVSIGFSAFSLISFHFLQKYRCVPKIGFPADISIDVLTDVSIDISIDVSTDKEEEEEEEEEGVDFS